MMHDGCSFLTLFTKSNDNTGIKKANYKLAFYVQLYSEKVQVCDEQAMILAM